MPAKPAGPRSKGAARPKYKGVEVNTVITGSGESRKITYVGRYTDKDGVRRTAAREPDWTTAFVAAVTAQKEVDSGAWGSPTGKDMLLSTLVENHYLPTLSPYGNTRKNVTSMLGNVEGKPKSKSARDIKGAQWTVLARFGKRRIGTITRDEVEAWLQEMLQAGYSIGTVQAKHSRLKVLLELATENHWIPYNAAAFKPLKGLQSSDPDRSISVKDWAAIRAQLSGETILLFVDTKLAAGMRNQSVNALRPIDLVPPTEGEYPRLMVRQAINSPGGQFTPDGKPFVVDTAGKGKVWGTVQIPHELYARLAQYVQDYKVQPEALIFDRGRAMAELDATRPVKAREGEELEGRYVNPVTGRSGMHGMAHTYDLGCHCLRCCNARTIARRYAARKAGRPTAKPWLEEGWLEERGSMVDPITTTWFSQRVWDPAIKASGITEHRTPHGLRHSFANWSLEGGANVRDVQQDMMHAKLTTTQIYVDRRAANSRDGSRLEAFERVANPDMAITPTPEPTPVAPAAALSMADAMWAGLTEEQKGRLLMGGLTQEQPAAEKHLRIVE